MFLRLHIRPPCSEQFPIFEQTASCIHTERDSVYLAPGDAESSNTSCVDAGLGSKGQNALEYVGYKYDWGRSLTD